MLKVTCSTITRQGRPLQPERLVMLGFTTKDVNVSTLPQVGMDVVLNLLQVEQLRDDLQAAIDACKTPAAS